MSLSEEYSSIESLPSKHFTLTLFTYYIIIIIYMLHIDYRLHIPLLFVYPVYNLHITLTLEVQIVYTFSGG